MNDRKPSGRRARAEAMRKERERAERRRRNLITGGIVVAVVALVAVAAFAISSATDDDSAGSDPDSVAFPENGIVYQNESANDPVDVVVYEDFQCPHCASFDAATRKLVESYVEDGTIRVAYQPLNYIDQGMSGATDYSMRAGNAATCVYDKAGGQAFHEFAARLFDQQKPEGSPGFSDDQYATYAKQAGAEGIESCLADLPHKAEIEERTRAFATSEVGANGTPSVVVDGEPLQDLSPAGLKAAIDEAAS